MAEPGYNFPRDLHDCYYATDPRINTGLQDALAGRNVVIVGAGRGVGQACAEFLTRAGCRSITCLALEQSEVEQTVRLCKQIRPDIRTKAAAIDNRDFKAVETSVRELEEELGSIDVLVMNAGRPGQWLAVAESDPELWWDTVAVSLQGAFNFSRAVLPGMRARKKGCIIFTSSSGAHTNQGMSGYTVAKLGQVRLAEMIHVENFKQHGITCFAFNPGCIRTRFFTDFEDVAHGKRPSQESYVTQGLASEEKSAMLAYNTLKDVQFDSPYMAAGLVMVIAAGQLDFLSGRYLDAAVDIQHYLSQKTEIVTDDLCRVRLMLGNNERQPTCDF